MNRSVSRRMPTRGVIGLVALLALAIPSGASHAASPDGVGTVEGFYGALLIVMKNGHNLGQSGRFAQLEPLIRQTFDIFVMARLAVGPSWMTLTETQRQQMIDGFGRYISALYADRFDSYAGQRFEVKGERPASDGIIVRSQVIRANGEPVNIDYMLRRSGDTWLISDVFLDGEISEVATRRSEFARILNGGGIGALVAALNRRADELVRPSISALPDPAR